jgi:hypothetical protein
VKENMKKISKKSKAGVGIVISALLIFAGGIFASIGTAHDTQDPLSLHEEPTTTPNKYDGSYVDPWFNLSAQDLGVPSSGVAYTKYAVNRLPTGLSSEAPQWENFADWTDYTTGTDGTPGDNVVFDGDISGIYEVIYYSADGKGNVEQDKHGYFEITVDTTAPETIFSLGGFLLLEPHTP